MSFLAAAGYLTREEALIFMLATLWLLAVTIIAFVPCWFQLRGRLRTRREGKLGPRNILSTKMLAPFALVAAAVALVVFTAFGWKGRMRDWTQQKRRLRIWRKKHDLPQHAKPEGDPPMPFHVRTKLGDPGDPRTGISTRDADNFLAAIRRAFGPQRKHRKGS